MVLWLGLLALIMAIVVPMTVLASSQEAEIEVDGKSGTSKHTLKAEVEAEAADLGADAPVATTEDSKVKYTKTDGTKVTVTITCYEQDDGGEMRHEPPRMIPSTGKSWS